MISVNVQSSPIGISVAGPTAVTAAAITGLSIEFAGDVELQSLQDGDVLCYTESKWRNRRDTDIVDGGNF